MLCTERGRRLDEYKNAVRYYSECVSRFADVAAEFGSNTEVELLHRLSLQAWNAAERARVALARHENEHFCAADCWGGLPDG